MLAPQGAVLTLKFVVYLLLSALSHLLSPFSLASAHFCTFIATLIGLICAGLTQSHFVAVNGQHRRSFAYGEGFRNFNKYEFLRFS